jgi:hypothetical protein
MLRPPEMNRAAKSPDRGSGREPHVGRSDAERLARAIRTRRIEAGALGLLAILPIVPYLTFLLRTAVPRFGVVGDIALLEQATRHVWLGDTLLGPWSRFRWNHPGPLYFYLVAPFEALFRNGSTGLYVGTCFVHALAVGSLVACARLFGRRAHAIAALLFVLAWFVAFGNVAAHPWGPLVVVLPLASFLVATAMFARGKSGAVYPAVLLGALAMQTHVSAVPTVVICGLVSLVAFLIGARRRGGVTRHEGWRLAIAGAIVFVLFVPPLVEQLTAPAGNLKKLWKFFIDREAPLRPLSVAVQNWITATSWLPDRVLHRSILDEGPLPLPALGRPLAATVTPTARTIAVVHIAAIAVAAMVAARRRDVVSLALLAFGGLADAIAVSALQAIVGPDAHFLVFFTTAGSTVAWIGVLATISSAIGAVALRAPRLSGVIAPALIVLGLTAAVTTTSMQRYWVTRNPIAASSRPDLRTDLRATVEALVTRASRDKSILVIHRLGASAIADGVLLELERDGVDVRIANGDRETYAGVRTANAVTRPLHVYFATSADPLPIAPCLEPAVKQGDLSAFVAPVETIACPPDKQAK